HMALAKKFEMLVRKDERFEGEMMYIWVWSVSV
ncbi:hypothetical protein DOY81_012014, partial [Sarcophaga bullata]